MDEKHGEMKIDGPILPVNVVIHLRGYLRFPDSYIRRNGAKA